MPEFSGSLPSWIVRGQTTSSQHEELGHLLRGRRRSRLLLGKEPWVLLARFCLFKAVAILTPATYFLGALDPYRLRDRCGGIERAHSFQVESVSGRRRARNACRKHESKVLR